MRCSALTWKYRCLCNRIPLGAQALIYAHIIGTINIIKFVSLDLHFAYGFTRVTLTFLQPRKRKTSPTKRRLEKTRPQTPAHLRTRASWAPATGNTHSAELRL